jgi:hypothetical protein
VRNIVAFLAPAQQFSRIKKRRKKFVENSTGFQERFYLGENIHYNRWHGEPTKMFVSKAAEVSECCRILYREEICNFYVSLLKITYDIFQSKHN